MDKFKELTAGAKLVLGAAIALLIVSWFHWFSFEGFGENMWHGVGVLAGLLILVLIVWQALRLVNIELEIGVTPSMITAALAVLTLICVFIRFIDKPGGSIVSDVIDRTFWAWLGLALAIVLVIGAWLNMQAAGENFSSIRDQISSATSGMRGDDRPDAPATAPPATPPVTPPPPAPPETSPADDPDTPSAT
jgi:hypothetical protein